MIHDVTLYTPDGTNDTIASWKSTLEGTTEFHYGLHSSFTDITPSGTSQSHNVSVVDNTYFEYYITSDYSGVSTPNASARYPTDENSYVLFSATGRDNIPPVLEITQPGRKLTFAGLSLASDCLCFIDYGRSNCIVVTGIRQDSGTY